jgi:2',5'-phosphodiesterase
MFAKMWQFVRSLFATTTLPPPKKDAWQMAAGRKNCVLQTRLVDKQENLFSVFNYHMPCMFRDPDVMNIHARTLLQVCNKQAEAEPFILCGDFNAQPASDVLKILKGRAIELPKSTKFKIAPVLPCEPRLRCAHEQLGHMPPFTNFSHTKHSETEFKGVIDYIFISNEFDIVDVSQQPASDAAGTFPNAVEPSDHIDLSATARLISKP